MPSRRSRELRPVSVLLSAVVALIGAGASRASERSGAAGVQDALDQAAAAIGGWRALARVESVRGLASVDSPRGPRALELRSARGGRFVMRQLRDGKPTFEAFVGPGVAATGDGAALARPDLALVLGHDFFGIALDPRAVFTGLSGPAPGSLAGGRTVVLEGRDVVGGAARLHFDARSSRLAGFEVRHPRKPGVTVVVTMDAWAEVAGVSLPSIVTARDDQGPWVVRFARVTANDLSARDFDPPPAPSAARTSPGASRSSDATALLRLHEEVLEGHRSRDARWLSSEEEDYVVANRGTVTAPTLAERRARFAGYLGATRFGFYRDRREPIVRVSDDGTLGWVVAEVEAEGTRTEDGKEEPVSFVSAWIELYAKADGSWRRVGNVSSFRP